MRKYVVRQYVGFTGAGAMLDMLAPDNGVLVAACHYQENIVELYMYRHSLVHEATTVSCYYHRLE